MSDLKPDLFSSDVSILQEMETHERSRRALLLAAPFLPSFFPRGRVWGTASTGAYCTSSLAQPAAGLIQAEKKGESHKNNPPRPALLITLFPYKEP